MASELSFVEYVCDQLGHLPGIAYRKMFGEYAFYHDQKVVALICDNQFYPAFPATHNEGGGMSRAAKIAFCFSRSSATCKAFPGYRKHSIISS